LLPASPMRRGIEAARVLHGSFMRQELFLSLGLLGFALNGCAQEEYPLALYLQQHPSADAQAPPEAGAAQGTCHRASAQPLPQRLATMSAQTSGGNDLVYIQTLDDMFQQNCGSCHGTAVDPPGLGNFQIQSAGDFALKMNATVLKHVMSDGPTPGASSPSTDPSDPMPPLSSPNGGPFSKRSSSDPIKIFADLVETWLADGSPQAFSPTATSGDAGAVEAGTASQSPFLLTSFSGNTMTNLGYCVPDKAMVGTDHARMTQLDAKFAAMAPMPQGAGVTAAQLIGLPEDLADTDLYSFDTALLAQSGVIAFQPNYPLWTDGAGKQRYVRVPVGTSIQFNTETQEFTIPPNTRFYKTFMKQIADTDGSLRWKKIETRLIVSRPDIINPGGSATPQALFGTYQWNSDETDATLVETPLRDGLPFSDTLIQYTTDEQLASAILASKPLLPLEALLEGGAARHYAIPSSDRCVQCHMGSNSASFVLGFRPVQMNRKPPGVSGTMIEPGQEPPGDDELTQLQRLLDYGIITGMDSPDDVLPLEQAEGSRSPRNDYELTAQAYMVGNCSHCHNPRGYPSVQNPVLVPLLNFLPGPNGGVFQFPLERYSPRIGRGPGGGELIPYITPSLMDQPSGEWNSSTQSSFDDDWNINIAQYGTKQFEYILYAPWRSLIFRNVQTPFAYEDNLALFPHMPMNMPGYDQRAQQIMSDWMVSIPALRKHPEIPEYAIAPLPNQIYPEGIAVDDDPQPYAEVTPGSPLYDEAVAAAQERIGILHTGVNPDVPASFTYSVYTHTFDTSDIMDPAVLLDPVCHEVPTPETTNNPIDEVTPDHDEWVNTDLSQAPNPPGTFSVRRPDWPQTLALEQFQAPVASCGEDQTAAVTAQNDVKLAVSLLQNVSLNLNSSDPFYSYATTKVPFGIWEQKPECDFSKQPTAGSIPADQAPLWFGVAKPAPTDPLFMSSPGQSVFQMICINCHGPDGAADGRLAVNLATMTGGNAIVANFRDGIFGPLGSPGLHRQEAFADSQLPMGVGPDWTGASIDTRASRYLAWMALGGTEVQIPLSILTIVGDTRVLGVKRTLPQSAISGNMLSAAKAICAQILQGAGTSGVTTWYWTQGWFKLQTSEDGTTTLDNLALLLPQNGDAEMWMRLCSFNNPPPVRVVQPDWTSTPVGQQVSGDVFYLIDPVAYGTSLGAGNQNAFEASQVAPLNSTNLLPWCVLDDGTPGVAAFLAQAGLPPCPSFAMNISTCGSSCWTSDDIDRWATRGAVNAGLAVFTYVDSLVKTLAAGGSPPPTYDSCEQLP
jgi:mono/diheme cytochrome c family protein